MSEPLPAESVADVADVADLWAAGAPPGLDYRPADLRAAPALSVITPFFDADPGHFAATARSLFAQSLQQFEWIIVDDGSRSPEAARALAQVAGDPRVRLVRHAANRGLAAARNSGFAAARTEWVVQLDADDLLAPTALEKWLWCLDSWPLLSFCKGFTRLFGGERMDWTRGFHSGNAFLVRNQTDPVALVRRSVHQAVGGYDESNRDGLEDWEFWLRCASHGHWGATVPELLSGYRREPARGADRWRHWDEGPAQRAFRARLRERYPRLWRDGVPRPAPCSEVDRGARCAPVAIVNALVKRRPRTLVIAPRGSGDDGDELVASVRSVARDGDELSVAIIDALDRRSLASIERVTPDFFVLPHFLPPEQYARFVRYLARSRQVDRIVDPSGADCADRLTGPVVQGDSTAVLFPRATRGLGWRARGYRVADAVLDRPHRWALRRGWLGHRALAQALVERLLRSH